MVKFSMDDNTALNISSAAALAFGTPSVVAPRKYCDLWQAPNTPAMNETLMRYHGIAAAAHGVVGLAVSAAPGNAEAKKNLLGATGAMWGAFAINNVHNACNKKVAKDVGFASGAVCATLSGLCLWRALDGRKK